MPRQHRLYRLLASLLVLALVLSSAPMPSTSAAPITSALLQPASSGLYRTHVTVENTARRARLEKLDVLMLAEGDGRATVLVTADQIEALARLRFQPRGSDDLTALAAAAEPEKVSLAGILRPLLVQAEIVQGQRTATAAAGAPPSNEALASLRTALQSLTAEQRAGIAGLTGVDDDADGLTNTEEGWWCTNPNTADTDGDQIKDGQEVSQLLAGNRTNGKPFLGWPSGIPGCYDDDFDSVPDLAETNVIGLSANRESTDLDKYDDGQEFFGVTYCPGGAGSCGYGALPRTEDLYLGSNMPSFVKAPGNSPWVAAFPDPAVLVVDGSLNVQAVTTITTDHTMGSGESHSYATSTTRGTSTSNVDLTTWNDWQEVKDDASPAGLAVLHPAFAFTTPEGDPLRGTLLVAGGTLAVVAFAACTAATLGACGGVIGLVALASGAILGTVAIKDGVEEFGPFNSDEPPDTIHNALKPGKCSESVAGSYTCIPDDVEDYQDQWLIDLGSEFFKYQDPPSSESGTNFATTPTGTLEMQKSHDGQIPGEQVDWSRLEPVTHAKESGGIKGTITTEYAETTVTQGQEFSTSESWSEATAVDTAHAADLRFTYSILNDGTDVLREMDGLLFNVYLASGANPIYTYNAIAQTGILHNLQPRQNVTFASNPIPLTLQQMAEVDQGTQVFITVEHLSYGGDQLFFQDAVQGGLVVAMDDGWADGDEKLDLYVMPCFGSPCGSDPNETVQEILQRGFPSTEDPEGNLLAISTPEINGSQVQWVEHQLDYDSWWNVYLSDGIGYTGALSTTLPSAGEAMAVRFLADADLDGYNDRTEEVLGTDPDDPSSHPQPELIAGAVSQRAGNDVVARMAFLNTGPYDATGVEAIAYAPNDSITIHDNTIGGSGRVGAGKRVILGGKVHEPVLGTGWSGTAKPASSGQYRGASDKTYTFTAAASGSIGAGNLIFNWSDGANSGQLQLGGVYRSPLPVSVGSDGVQISFNSGAVTAGNSFTVRARPAGDTITYTVNREPYTPPVFVVSYNDPQGNHRFVTPAILSDLDADLAAYSDQMVEDLGLNITTVAPFAAGSTNTTYYTTNSPDQTPIEDAHLFLEYINAAGVTVAEQVFTRDLEPGPTVWQVSWDTSVFTETFTTAEDYKILALWTDGQGDIIDTAVRPLASFQVDPRPKAAATQDAWDFGTVHQGTPLYHDFTVANSGHYFMPYMALTDVISGTLMGGRLGNLAPADSAAFGLRIDTTVPQSIDGSVRIRTADLDAPEILIPVRGTILPTPNLSIAGTDIAFSNNTPANGAGVTIQATVHNTSTHTVRNVAVRFYDGDPGSGGVQIGSELVIPEIGAGSTAVAQAATTYATGHNHFYVAVDPANTVPETDEYDNTARGFVHVQTALPPNGALTDGQVFRISGATSLPPAISVSDGAALILENVSAGTSSLTIGERAVILLDNSDLTVTEIRASLAATATVVSLTRGSNITSTMPIMIVTSLLSLEDSGICSAGPAGTTPADRSDLPGGPGGLGRVEVHAREVRAFHSRIAGQGGAGGAGSRNTTFGGTGGDGGEGQILFFANNTVLREGATLIALSGQGGTGGYSTNSTGGKGGTGGAATFDIQGNSLLVADSNLTAQGGSGGSPGHTSDFGPSGGAGGRASSTLSVQQLLIDHAHVTVAGGYGINGDPPNGTSVGGSGDVGGGAMAVVTTSTVGGGSVDLTARGGNGGSGADAAQVGGSGAAGGAASLSFTSATIKIGELGVTIEGGGAGRGGTAFQSMGGINYGGNGGAGGAATYSFHPGQFAANAAVISVLGSAGGTGGASWGSRNRGGQGGAGGKAEFTASATRFGCTNVSTDLGGGGGGAGGDTRWNGTSEDRGGSGGNGGSVRLDWTAASAWRTTSAVWSAVRGAGGAAGAGYVPGAPGVNGSHTARVTDGYEASSPGRELLAIGEMTPNLLSLHPLGTAALSWNSGVTNTVSSPYETAIPRSAGLNTLNLHYAYVDGTTADSQHGFYVYGDGDNDGDGLSDRDEARRYRTDPVLPDTDSDGMNDGAEIAAHTDALNPDSDYDGVPDGQDPDALNRADLTLAAPSFGEPSPTEGQSVGLSATLSNAGSHAAKGAVAAFFDGDPAHGGRYLCAAFVAELPHAGASAAHCAWDTSGITGIRQIFVVADPNDRIGEENENNNKAFASITIRTRADLAVAAISPAQPEVVVGQPITLTAVVSNTGQTDAAGQQVTFFDGGTPIGTASVPVPAGASRSVAVAWTPATLGSHTLRVVADAASAVQESNEANNETTTAAYVGFATPLYIDAGAATDVAYNAATGYGWRSSSFTVTWGSQPYQTARLGASGVITYQYDHLLPSRFYHLDLTLLEGDAVGRTETAAVDGIQVGAAVALAGGQPHYLSLLVPPASYQDHGILASIRAAGANGAVISELKLHDILYCYRDSGGSPDPRYEAGVTCGGFLDPNATATAGATPEASYRTDLSDNTLQYRFDNLLPSRHYQLNLTLYRAAANTARERVLADGVDLGVEVNLGDQQPHRLVLDLPREAYLGDGSVVVTVRRTDGPTGAFANEIALEEKTLLNLPVISDLQVTNVTAERATISWLTDAATDGAVHYGTTATLGNIALDERGTPVSARTHQVNLLNLAPQNTYSFYALSSDAIDDHGGAYYQFTTGPAFNPSTSDLAFGRVLRSDGSTPASGALVRAKLRDADAEGSPGDSALLSALVDSSGYWSFDLAATRITNYSQIFDYSPAGDRLVLDVTDGAGCTASQIVDTGLDVPAPDMILVCPTQVTHNVANGWNLLGLNVQTEPMPAAEAALDDIVAQGGSAIEIERWWNGGWDAHVRDLPFNNFTLELGRGYFVRAGAASPWTRTGRPPVAPLSLSLYSGWNLIGLPKLTSSLLAEDLLSGIAAQGGACPEVDRWVSGGWVGHPKGFPVNNFAITTTEGYFVKCTKQSTYTPGATTLASSGPAQPPAAEVTEVEPAADPVIFDVTVTNLRDVAFSVTWRTDQPSKGWLAYRMAGGSEAFTQDDRGAGVVSTIHQVTVANLSPETTYAFRVHSGNSVAERDGNGQPFQAVTLATTSPGVPLTAFGQVLGGDGKPAAGALVRAWLINADQTRSAPLSALVENEGYWALSLPAEGCEEKQLALYAFGPDGAVAQGTSPACAEGVQPAPTLTLRPKARMPIYLPLVVR